MVFIVNLIFALLAGLLTDYLMRRVGAEPRMSIIVAILVGIVIFIANLAKYIL